MKKFLFLMIFIILYAGYNLFFEAQTSARDKVRIAFIGDSITDKSFFEHKEYPQHVESILPNTEIKSYGVGGGAFCRRSKDLDESYPPLVDRLEDVGEADIYFILLGTNDYSNSVPIGASDSEKLTEFNGCLNHVLKGLKHSQPEATIILSSILKRKDNNLELSVSDYNDVIFSKSDEYGVLFFDGNGIKGLDIGGDHQGEITEDRLHPNKAGAKKLGESVAEFLRSEYVNL